MAMPYVVALEIGTTKVCALVGELREDGSIMVTGMGECASRGVRKGQVVDLEIAVACVRRALRMAEEHGQVTIEQVYVAVSDGCVQSIVHRGSVPVAEPEEGVSDEDIEAVKDVARAVNLPPDRQLLHSIAQYYHIDNHEDVVNPRGMVGNKLSVDMLIIHGVRSPLQNTMNVVRSVPMDAFDPAFSGLCSGLAVLSPEQKRSGVVLIDLGGGTTDYVAYAGNALAQAGALGVGGDHITNDLVAAFGISTTQAEALKREAGSAIPRKAEADRRVNVPPELGFPARSIALADLDAVIHARVEETLHMVRVRLAEMEVAEHFGAGVVLCGGGAYLRGIRELAEEVFALPCVVGRPRNVSGLGTVTERPQYAAPLGLIRYAFKTMPPEEPVGLWDRLRVMVEGR